MTAVLGILAWVVTLAPMVYKLILLLLRSVPKVAPKVAGPTIWATAFVAIIKLLPFASFALMWVIMREEMFLTMSDYILPLLLAPVRFIVDQVTVFIPDLTQSPLMSIVANFDLAQPLSIILIGWSIATIYGFFYRVVTK